MHVLFYHFLAKLQACLLVHEHLQALLPGLLVVSLPHLYLLEPALPLLLIFLLNVSFVICLDDGIPNPKLFRVVTVHLPDPV